MKEISLVFPHQLFKDNPVVSASRKIFLVEETLFFRQYNFHKQKLKYHRAGMKFYAEHLKEKGFEVIYVEALEEISDIRLLIPHLKTKGVESIHYIDPVDNWLEKRILSKARQHEIRTIRYNSPMFLNTEEDLNKYFKDKKMYQTTFYKDQRKKRGILVNKSLEPMGGKWTFDTENRLKYPRDKKPPKINFPVQNEFQEDAAKWVNENFSKHPGSIDSRLTYPSNFKDSRKWTDDFFTQRFKEFGPYEDAIVAEATFLHHSVLSPMLNVGFITPGELIKEALKFAEKEEIPANSLEGFIRQVMGWREFIRAVYILKGSEERTTNFWGFKRSIPSTFWTGETGVFPVDNVIRKVLDTGYAHHIERLMVLGNFMLLCEFDPDEVYRWFMEMFIDAYDWVMVPNVYGMSQFADGGLMSSKPYLSGSNYLRKMANYPQGEWQQLWDGLFWRFLDTHRDFFSSNPRMGMLLKTFDRMEESRKESLLGTAESYLSSLDN